MSRFGFDYGEVQRPSLLAKIKKAVDNRNLVFVHDEHEQRLKIEVLQFESLLVQLDKP